MRLVALLCGFFGVCFAAPSFAAELLTTSDGTPLSWPRGKHIVLHVDPAHAPTDGATFMKLLEEGFSVWNDAAAQAPTAEAVIGEPALGDEQSHRVQVLQEDWPYDDATLAVTTYTYSKKTGALVDADIVVNGNGPCFSTADNMPSSCYDLLSVLAHEAGHFLGLDHNPNDADAVMYPTLAAGDTRKRVLSDDDRAGIAMNYGAASSQAAPKATAVTNGAAREDFTVARMGCSQAEPSGALMFLLVGAVLFLRRARRVLAVLVVALGFVTVAEASSHKTGAAIKMISAEETEGLVLGRAIKGHSFVDPKLGLVMTEYTVETVACLGTTCEPQGRFVMLGGEVNGLVTRVAGEPEIDEKSTFIFSTLPNRTTREAAGTWKRIPNGRLPLELLQSLEARGLLRATITK
jgi:hypothetical protein